MRLRQSLTSSAFFASRLSYQLLEHFGRSLLAVDEGVAVPVYCHPVQLGHFPYIRVTIHVRHWARRPCVGRRIQGERIQSETSCIRRLGEDEE